MKDVDMEGSIVLRLIILWLWKDNGIKINLMDMADALIVMATFILDNIKMDLEKDLDSIFGIVEMFMMAHGFRIIRMAMDHFI